MIDSKNSFSINTKIIERKTKFTGETTPIRFAAQEASWGKRLRRMSPRENSSQNTESSIRTWDLRIFRRIQKQVMTDVKTRITRSIQDMATPPFF